jgi:aryl-alcohol dehydrogenase-like predicted oxidoreductase
MKKVTRRKFIKTSAGFVAAAGLAGCSESTEPPPVVESKPTTMATRALGKTGFNVCIFSLGGQAALETPGLEDLSGEIITRALDLGVNYIDTSAYYGGDSGQFGLSERNIGRATNTRRDEVFLATKTLRRGYSGAMNDLEQSLTNLQTDHVDLWQAHNVRTLADMNSILAPGGAYEAFEQAKTEGTTRFFGVTGHFNPWVLQKLITAREFDTILTALNAADIHHKSFVLSTLPTAVFLEMGIIAMKVPARGRIFQEGGISTMKQALGYTLTHPVSTAIVGCSSVAEVEENVEIAINFKPYPEEEMRQLEALTASYYTDAGWFKDQW